MKSVKAGRAHRHGAGCDCHACALVKETGRIRTPKASRTMRHRVALGKK